MDDLDSLFEGDLASINEVFQEFEIKDKQDRKRQQLEEEEIKKIQNKEVTFVEMAVPVVSLEEVSKRRSMEVMTIEKQWKDEMEAMEKEQLKRLLQEPETDLETDIVLQNLDNELKSLIQSKVEEVKVTQHEKELRAQREKEERERREKERQEKLAHKKEQQELTIEEWIAWMEEKKKKGMTPAQLEEYEHRKEEWQIREKAREEKRKREEEEQIRKTRERIDGEIESYRRRVHEVEESRLTDEEIRYNFEELARKNEEEVRQRREKTQMAREVEKQRELDELKPKARSALAARWEESVKAKSKGNNLSREEHRATVVTGGKTTDEEVLEREEERLTRRISGSFPNGAVKLSPEKPKRHSYHS